MNQVTILQGKASKKNSWTASPFSHGLRVQNISGHRGKPGKVWPFWSHLLPSVPERESEFFVSSSLRPKQESQVRKHEPQSALIVPFPTLEPKCYPKSNGPLTPQLLRTFPSCEHYSDEEAEEIVTTIKTLARTLLRTVSGNGTHYDNQSSSPTTITTLENNALKHAA